MQLGARMDCGPAAPGTETPTRPRRTRAGGGFGYAVKMRDGGPRPLFNERVAANIAQRAGPSVAAPTTAQPGAEFAGRAPAPRPDQTQLGPCFPTGFCDKACAARGTDRALGGPPAERGMPDAGHDALKGAALPGEPDKMRVATRPGKISPAARPGALGRWVS